eukprot:2262665-Ditylum_brightwellii.AAC.1
MPIAIAMNTIHWIQRWGFSWALECCRCYFGCIVCRNTVGCLGGMFSLSSEEAEDAVEALSSRLE